MAREISWSKKKRLLDELKYIDPTATVVEDENGKKVSTKSKSTVTRNVEDLALVRDDILTQTDYKTKYSSMLSSSFPLYTSKNEKPEDRGGIFAKGAFRDGYQKGDIPRTAVSTIGDIAGGLLKGAAYMGEGIYDAGMYLGAGIADNRGDTALADERREKAKKNSVNNFFEPFETEVDKNSLLGESADKFTNMLGQVGGLMLTGAAGVGLGAAAGLGAAGAGALATGLTTGATFMSSTGSGMSQAYQEGATDEEALKYGLIAGFADAATELIFGGLGKAINAKGLSTGLSSADDMLAKKVTEKINNVVLKNTTELGIKASGEGLEEVLAGGIQAFGQWKTYRDEDEEGNDTTFLEILQDQDLLEQFILGALVSGTVQSPSAYKSTKQGRDYITGYTQNEQSVIDNEIKSRTTEKQKQKAIEDRITRVIEEREGVLGTLTDAKKQEIRDEVMSNADTLDFSTSQLGKKELSLIEKAVMQDLKRGELSIDSIEDTLVGNERAQIKALREQLEQTTDETQKAEIEARIGELELSKNETMREMLQKDTILQNSYREANLRSQKFEYEKSETDSEFRKNLADDFSKVANNSTKSHELFETISKIAEDRQTAYGVINNEQLKELGVDVEGKTVNGLVKVNADGTQKVLINVDSDRAIEFTVGHETTHLLEGTQEYTELQEMVKQYATTKGEYDARLKEVTKLYEGVQNANVEAEVTSDLVGEYIFTDADFVNQLSVEKPSIFKKIFDEIKHLYKLATAGSKEARQLEQAKKAFEKAYKANNVAQAVDSDVKFSVVGENSKTANLNTLSDAKKMLEEGKDMDSIFKQTGWYQQSDGKWRSEISDQFMQDVNAYNSKGLESARTSRIEEKARQLRLDVQDEMLTEAEYQQEIEKYTARINEKGITNGKLSEFLDAPDLFAAYPQLKDVNVSYTLSEKDAYGSYNPDTNTIRLKPSYDSSMGVTGREALLHEIQHVIQGIEGFAKGTTPTKAGSFSQYENAGGEIEARDTASRMRMSDAERRENPPVKYSVSNRETDGFVKTYNQRDKVVKSLENTLGKKYNESFTVNGVPATFDGIEVSHGAGSVATFYINFAIDEGGYYDRLTIRYSGHPDSTGTSDAHIWNSDTVSMADLKSKIDEKVKEHINENSKMYDTYVADSDVKYSLADNKGRELSKEQQEYFKDSKVRDDEGKLIEVYHGTRNADFTEFNRSWNFFTDSEEMADSYSPNGEKHVGYLNISNPYIIDAKGDKWSGIAIDEETKQMLQDYGASVFKERGAWRTSPADIVSAIQDMVDEGSANYDGVIIKNVDDTGSYAKGENVIGNDYIAFNSNQFKNVDNTSPTESPDIRFSLSKPVEQTKNLVAVHNLTEEKLNKSLNLGGLPMPSIAIARAKEGHSTFGDISLVFNSDTIDPENSKNKVYSGDAWTPTYPHVDYKVNETKADEIKDKVFGLLKSKGYRADDFGYMSLYSDDVQDNLNRNGGNWLEGYQSKDGIKAAYLIDKGIEFDPATTETTLDGFGRYKNDQVIAVYEALGEEKIKELYENRDYTTEVTQQITDALNERLNKQFEEKAKGDKEVFKALKALRSYNADDINPHIIIEAAYKYAKNGIESKIDPYKTRDVLDELIDKEDYNKWLNNLSEGIVEKEGLRNKVDLFTPSGSRRSFEALHYEHNLENVVKAMKESGTKGIGSWGGGNIFGASTTEYKSISEIKSAADERLKNLSEEEYEKIRSDIRDRYYDIISRIPDNDSFSAVDSADEMITEAITKYGTSKDQVASYLKRESQGWATVSEQDVDEIIELVNEIKAMPTGYFEAKPQRAVGFDEVAAVVVPDNVSAELENRLLEKGLNVVKYEAGNKQARADTLNSLEDVKFSLSNPNSKTAPTKGTYWKDILYNPETQVAQEEDIAPVKPQETVQPTLQEDDTDYAPLTQNELESLEREREEAFYQMTDADEPIFTPKTEDSLPDSMTIDKKSMKQLSKVLSENLFLNRAGKQEIEKLIQKVASGEVDTREQLYGLVEEKFGTQYETLTHESIAEAKSYIRSARIKVSDTIKGDIPDYGSFMRKNFGKIRFSNEGVDVDVMYMEFNSMFPDLFPDDIWNPTDQLIRIAEVSNLPVEDLIPTKIPMDMIMDAGDLIYDSVQEYKDVARLEAAKAYERLPIDESLMPPEDTSDNIAYLPKEERQKKHIEASYKKKDADRVNSLTDADAPIPYKRGQLKGDIAPVKVETEDTYTKTRKELRKELLGDKTQGEWFKQALDSAKNRPMALLNNTDTIRATELVFGRENGNKINEIIFQKAIDNESDSIKWQEIQRDRLRELKIKSGSKESAAVQKYGEKQWADENGDVHEYGDIELAKEFPDIATRNKIKSAANEIRSMYDEYIDIANGVLTGLGFDPIPKRADYMRHFQELNDVFTRFGIPFNAQALDEHTLPTDINGLTDTWSPQKNYFANIQPRKGVKTNLDAIKGIDGYIGGIANLIYHTEDIQRGRAFEDMIRETYGEEKGWENLENLPKELQIERAEKIQNNHLSNYAAWVHEWTNNMAGKKSKVDRSIEAMFGRKAFAVLDETRKQVGANMIGLNLSSSLTNLIASVQGASKTNKLAVAKGTADTIKNIFYKDNFIEKNRFLTARMGTDMVSQNAWQKMQNAGFIFMKGMDWFSSNQIVRSKYYELRAKGMSEEQAHAESGKFAARIMGDRTKGANAQLYNSKMIGLVTQFQLEVNNQLYSMFYDTYHESKEAAQGNAAKATAGYLFTLGQLAAFTHLFGQTFESIAGYNPTFDILGIIAAAFGLDDDEEKEDTTVDNLKQASDKLVDALPYVNILTGGGRIPVASGIPNLIAVATGGEDQYGNEVTLKDELKKLQYLVLPTGGNQIKKTTQGLAMFDDDLPVSGSYTDSGSMRFPVEDTPLNRIQASIFGQWANENASSYFDNERKPLKENQIQEYADLDMPIADYWKYRDGLSEQKTLEDKFEYVDGLDVTDRQKNIMINNIVDRDEKVDMSNYSDFGSYEEFDFATKNPDKYDFLERNGISYSEYDASKESRKEYNEAYEWVQKNPDKYVVSQAITSDFTSYRQYYNDLNDLKADKDSNGKTISGSNKTKVIDYIDNLDLDYGAKLILYKTEYKSDDDVNYEIINYLNNREDIDYDQMVTILTELDMKVDSNGNITWD